MDIANSHGHGAKIKYTTVELQIKIGSPKAYLTEQGIGGISFFFLLVTS